ncbi:hypothetical protein [Acinetobacter proteolyticus]|uniref:Uncharacterized protein n=1 Tax=Acinetobacter proteolyticus TaxID=1776741 RepID=A0A2N0WEU3_9GAMM|nr:hypothetical protein [Acinetobacter proteolyticus]PKF33388.1 hypothetical protein CW311_11320 [Acinetobacter proteolyticus]
MVNTVFIISLDILKVLTPFIIAIGVYLLWHKQKEKEVVASEAKNSLTILNSMLAKKVDFFTAIYDIEELFKVSLTANEEFDRKLKSLHTELLDLAGELEHSLHFICDAKNNNELRSEFVQRLTVIVDCIKDLEWNYRVENLSLNYIYHELQEKKKKSSYEISEGIQYFKLKLVNFALYRN